MAKEKYEDDPEDGDAVDESKQIICCGLRCSNCAIDPACDCVGCSGKIGICCLNLEVCCKPGTDCLPPCGCCGIQYENDGCSLINSQVQCCCCVVNAAIPCNKEVPVTLAAFGFMVYPKCGCCVVQSEFMER